MKWSQIQQNVPIPICFIPETLNSGQARIRGVEFQAFGRPLANIQARLSVSYQDPKITNSGLSPTPLGTRIYGVPYFTGSAALTYTHQITENLDAFVSTDYSYTGNSLSDTTSSLFGLPPITRAGYGIWNAKFGAEWGKKRFWLYFHNITNVMANLGDINPLSYPEVNSVTGLPDPRVAVSRPFQVGLGFSYGM
jgi:outer membrane receptor protein involved in Fe transport